MSPPPPPPPPTAATTPSTPHAPPLPPLAAQPNTTECNATSGASECADASNGAAIGRRLSDGLASIDLSPGGLDLSSCKRWVQRRAITQIGRFARAARGRCSARRWRGCSAACSCTPSRGRSSTSRAGARSSSSARCPAGSPSAGSGCSTSRRGGSSRRGAPPKRFKCCARSPQSTAASSTTPTSSSWAVAVAMSARHPRRGRP